MASNTKFSFIFPGQGSQSPGMGKFLWQEFSEARQTFEEASDGIGIDLKKLCFDSDEKTLSLTENTQPALLTVSVATSKVLNLKLGLKPAMTAGHSIGEYGALVTSQVIDFQTAIKAVRLRGQAMQSAVPVGEGSMAAVMGLDALETQKLCDWIKQSSQISGVLSPANYNSPGQIVISGSASLIEWAQKNFKGEEVFQKKVRLIPLQVSAPFHCELMKPAEEKMRLFFASVNFREPTSLLVQNFTAHVESQPERIKENLVRQVSAPVLWMQSMEKSLELDLTQMIECGHGKVLSGLLKKINGDRFAVYGVNSLEDLKLIEERLK